MSNLLNDNLVIDHKKNHELIEQHAIEGTPFTLVTIKDKGSYASLGNYRITEIFEKKESAIQKVEKPTWEIILACIIAVTHQNRVNPIDL